METLTDFSTALQQELDYRVDLMADAAKEEGEPFERGLLAFYQATLDIETSDYWKEFGREIRDWQIKLGVYVEMTLVDITNTTVSRGKPWDFKRGSVAYRFAGHPAGFSR